MTNFEGHLRLGVLAAVLVSAAGLLMFWVFDFTMALSVKVSAIMFAVAVIGSTISDVDHQASKPRRYLGMVLIAAGVGGAAIIYQRLDSIVAAIENFLMGILSIPGNLVAGIGFLTFALGGALAALTVGAVIDSKLTHRGVTHSKEFALLFGLVSAALVAQFMEIPTIAVAAIGAAGVIGVFVHYAVGDR